MSRPIGYYVHHQGAGHLHRARLIAAALTRPCTLIGTFAEPPDDATTLDLPDDRMDEGFGGIDDTANRPEALHYAPIGRAGIRTRMAAIAEWIAANDPALLIVDVSVEVAFLVRLLSVPVVLVRLAGRRDDQPHLEAFRAAEVLIAPFPAAFEAAETPTWVVAKTSYAGFLAEPIEGPRDPVIAREIAVVLGRGSAPMEVSLLAEAARATPDWTWRVHGDTLPVEGTIPANLHLNGWVDNIGISLDRAEIVVGGAGDGLLAAVVARGKPFVCLPEPRAFHEQIEKARVLKARNLAIILPHWPDASEWADILRRAMMLDPMRLQAFYNPYAVTRTAAVIESIAARFDR